MLLPYSDRRILKLLSGDRRLSFVGPQSIFFVPDTILRIQGSALSPVIINPGSVGQPRNDRPEAIYALHSGDELRFRWVTCDIVAAQEKIRAMPIDVGARDYLTDRLMRGE